MSHSGRLLKQGAVRARSSNLQPRRVWRRVRVETQALTREVLTAAPTCPSACSGRDGANRLSCAACEHVCRRGVAARTRRALGLLYRAPASRAAFRAPASDIPRARKSGVSECVTERSEPPAWTSVAVARGACRSLGWACCSSFRTLDCQTPTPGALRSRSSRAETTLGPTHPCNLMHHHKTRR